MTNSNLTKTKPGPKNIFEIELDILVSIQSYGISAPKKIINYHDTFASFSNMYICSGSWLDVEVGRKNLH